jgi:diguanylate cyclase (GGDEF)-like protein/PAS domain S-box-containing protein
MVDWPTRIQDFVDGVAASCAIVSHDEDGALVVSACNERFFDMTGGRGAGVDSCPFPFDALVPSYARPEIREKLQGCFKSSVPLELVQAYHLRDGVHWWRLALTPFLHEVLIRGIEITEQMNLQYELETTTSRFRSVVDAAYDAIITIDQEHNITLFNRAAGNLFGYDPSEVMGGPIDQLIPEKLREHHSEYIRRFLRSPVHSRQMDERNLIHGRHRDGRLIPLEIAIFKINVGRMIEFTAIVRDIEDRVRLMHLLQKQAETDQLTGLPNRRAFYDVVGAILKSTERLSLLMLDIDHFKNVNDTYGHDAGDEVLRVLAKVGTAACRKMDVVARWGGEEFVVALPGAEVEQARVIAEKLRARYEAQDFVHAWHNDLAIPFTVSIGVTEHAPNEHDVEVMLKRVDEALYKAKNTGRNRVEVR